MVLEQLNIRMQTTIKQTDLTPFIKISSNWIDLHIKCKNYRTPRRYQRRKPRGHLVWFGDNFFRYNTKSTKRQATDWEGIPAKYLSDKGYQISIVCVSKIYKDMCI